jgi:hypothetical protein
MEISEYDGSESSNDSSSDDNSINGRKTKSLGDLSDNTEKIAKKIKNKSLPNLATGFLSNISSFIKVNSLLIRSLK